MNSNFLQLPGQMNGQRPFSMMSNGNGAASPSMNPRQFDQRTLSMVDPGIAARSRQSFLPPVQGVLGGNGMGFNSGSADPVYTPSIAPSERSNIGNASRYRPVSMALPQQRSSTFTSSTLPWNEDARRNSLTSPSANNLPVTPATTTPTPTPKSITPTVTVRPVSQLRTVNTAPVASSGLRNSIVDHDDDDDGWEEMMKNREKKKTGWKFKKGTTGFGDLFHGHHNQI